MDYYIFIAEHPIKLEIVSKLSAYGIIIPYDSKCIDINTYGYYPDDLSVEGKQALQRAIPNIILTKDKVSITEIQRQANKIQEQNEIKQGSLVYHRDYKKLPMLVTFTDGVTATVFHSLRTRPLSVTCGVEMLVPADTQHDLPTYKVERPNHEFKQKLYIDCDIFDTSSIDTYNQQMFLTLLRLRMSYLSAGIVLVNPVKQDNDILDLLGFESVYGSLLALVARVKPDILVSNSKLINHPHKCLYQDMLQEPSYIVSSEVDSQMYVYGLQHNKKHIREDLLRIKNGQTQAPSFDPPTLEYNTDLETIPATQPRGRDTLKAKLRLIGLDAFTTRLDDLVYTLTGRQYE